MAACPLASLDPSSGAVKEPGLQRIVADSFGLSPSPWPGRAHARDARHGDVRLARHRRPIGRLAGYYYVRRVVFATSASES
jgi:hypothetical protein